MGSRAWLLVGASLWQEMLGQRKPQPSPWAPGWFPHILACQCLVLGVLAVAHLGHRQRPKGSPLYGRPTVQVLFQL